KSAGIELSSALVQSAAEAARGLTATEAEDIFALSVVRTQQLESGLISSEKARAIAKDGILELSESRETLDSIGGLGELKSWTLRRRNAFSPRAREYGLPVPKGVLILGIPGTGKSLCAKASASAFGFPLLKLDAGKLFAGIVGESEANLRRAIQTAEAISPCILWIDEIEKGFSGSKSSGSTDGGTSARVFGSFISWMQEKTAPVFVVATANDISQLPPELLRKGRFDELFFVDLPDEAERRRIWEIHICRRERDPRSFDLQSLSDLSKGFTGSEIEQVVIDALFESFDRDLELTDEALTDAVIRTVPLSTTMAEPIRALRDWAKNRARPASIPKIGNTEGRKIAA
ncbi:AAA family ATPase, partial [Candidatus Bathyarchaeota archaeon]|nr:AAA family ATPase [Candidatus Bathyarchaeota archaeon]